MPHFRLLQALAFDEMENPRLQQLIAMIYRLANARTMFGQLDQFVLLIIKAHKLDKMGRSLI